ncbi:unnamed protein product, partial [Vitis vinifera]
MFDYDSNMRCLRPKYPSNASCSYVQSSSISHLLMLVWQPNTDPHICKTIFFFLTLKFCVIHYLNFSAGTAGQYAPPYLPTACYGNDVSKFPSSNLFASAGDGIWDNGAACGRQYFVMCLSAQTPGTCKAGQIIKVKIVDKASRNGVILVLSTIAFGAIANPSAASVNVEFTEA